MHRLTISHCHLVRREQQTIRRDGRGRILQPRSGGPCADTALNDAQFCCEIYEPIRPVPSAENGRRRLVPDRGSVAEDAR